MQNDPLAMYLIVRNIGMSFGKASAMIGHAVEALCAFYYEQASDIQKDIWMQWKANACRKITLSANDAEFDKVKELDCIKFVVKDAGYTELVPGTETVIGCYPMRKIQRPKILKRLKPL